MPMPLPSPTTFRVLSLDGGGIRGAFSAACLAKLESSVGRPITDYFDLITGTSTGGIIALALGLGVRCFIRELLLTFSLSSTTCDSAWVSRGFSVIKHV